MAMQEITYKGLLFNYCAKNKKNRPEFLCSSEGPSHDPRFTCQVLIDEKPVGSGEGKSKKIAEHRASKAALEALGYRETGIQPDFDALLNELCQKKGWSFSFMEGNRIGPSHNTEFTCKAQVDGTIYPESCRKKAKKLAKKEAAYLALKELKKMFPADIPALPEDFIDQSGSESCSLSGSNGLNLDKSPDENEQAPNSAAFPVSCQQNYISMLNEICQKKKWICNYLEKSVGTLSHSCLFTCKASIYGESIESKIFPESKPKKTKQLAKKEAAFLALKDLKMIYPSEIPTLPDVYVDDSKNENSSVSSTTQNRKSTTSWIISLASDTSGEILFQDSCPAHSNPARKSVENGVESMGFSSSSSTPNLPDPLRDFEDISYIDSGSFGKVMKAKKKLDEMYYAVKKVPMQNRDKEKRYLEEVRVLARLDHQNIVRYFNTWLANDYIPALENSESSYSGSDSDKIIGQCLFIQMELCDMGSLKKWIRKRNNSEKIDKKQSLQFFKQIIEAVKYIHSQKLIHRDLKPANIFFTKDMVVKIGDFGLVAHMTGDNETEARQRTQGTGTPSYMAPEQKDGKEYENEVDIYALGLILVELLWIFGTEHERRKEWVNIRDGILFEAFVTQYPIEECEIKKMLSKDPKNRPTAEQLKQFFETKDILDTRTY